MNTQYSSWPTDFTSGGPRLSSPGPPVVRTHPGGSTMKPRCRSIRRAAETCLAAALAGLLVLARTLPSPAQEPSRERDRIRLPEPRQDGTVSVERALAGRRSVRTYAPGPVPLAALGQILWAAQGVTRPVADPPPGFRYPWSGGLRTAPSAGALYPLEVYAAVGRVEGLEEGLYHYVPVGHALERVAGGDLREEIRDAALGQAALGHAPVTLVIAGVVERTAAKYGERAERYVHMEAGAAAQNVYLACASLGLGTVYIGAFRDDAVREALGLPPEEAVLTLMPIGRPGTE